MDKLLKKIIISFFVLLIFFSNSTIALAESIPMPQAPQAPQAPKVPQVPASIPQPPAQPPAPPQSTPQNQPAQNRENLPASEQNQAIQPENSQNQTHEDNLLGQNQPADKQSSQETNNPGEQVTTHQTGTTVIQTAPATNAATVVTNANNNSSETPTNQNNHGLENSENSTNGSASSNNSQISKEDNQTTEQLNQANIGNGLTLNTLTGQNSASLNLGDSSIFSGDANTSGTVITAANTNIDGVAVAQFSVNDNHTGDIILNLPEAGKSTTAVTNTGSGSSSTNTNSLSDLTNNNTFQQNEATASSQLTLNSDSGHNSTIGNTGGDSNIQTGNANASANVLTFLNNNLSGNVTLAVVDIFGNLVGNIILPESALTNSGNPEIAENAGNGSESTSSTNLTQNNNNNLNQTNLSDIQNNLNILATTGNNQTSENTGGNSQILTGEANASSKVLNVTNTNSEGGDIWLVLINKAGEWFGQILGAPDDATFAGSDGTVFNVSQNGDIGVTNNENGSGPENSINTNGTSNSQTTQTNNGKVVNDIDVSANTGGNTSMENTGGDSNIQTGDANVLVNLINFVNNNISSGHKLIVAIVNIFGSWTGDFVPPGEKPQKAPEQTTSQEASSQSSNQSQALSNLTSNQTQSSSSDSTITGTDFLPVNSPDPTDLNTSQNYLRVSGFKTTANPLSAVLGKTNTGENSMQKPLVINLAWLVLLVPPVLLTTGLIFLRKKAKTQA